MKDLAVINDFRTFFISIFRKFEPIKLMTFKTCLRWENLIFMFFFLILSPVSNFRAGLSSTEPIANWNAWNIRAPSGVYWSRHSLSLLHVVLAIPFIQDSCGALPSPNRCSAACGNLPSCREPELLDPPPHAINFKACLIKIISTHLLYLGLFTFWKTWISSFPTSVPPILLHIYVPLIVNYFLT